MTYLWGLSGVCVASLHLLSYGDSKSARINGDGYNQDRWQTHLEMAWRPCGPRFDIVTPTGIGDGYLARGSNTVAQMQALIDADLAATGKTPGYILANLGTVEIVTVMPTEEDFTTDYGYILDAIHVKWPSAQVYVAKPWAADGDADANTIAGWIDAVLLTRSAWAHAGHDERVWAKGADNGATMMWDGIHYSTAGTVECARQWRAILGY